MARWATCGPASAFLIFIISALLRVLLAGLGFLLLIHAGDLALGLFQQHRLARALSQPHPDGEPLPIDGTRPIYRQRLALPRPQLYYSATLPAAFQTLFQGGRLHIDHVRLPASEAADTLDEERWLVQVDQWAIYFRLLCLVGILTLFGVVWVGVNFGWSVSPPILAPSSEYRLPARNLMLAYNVTLDDGDRPSLLHVLSGSAEGDLPVEEAGTVRLGGVDFFSQPTAPALLIESLEGTQSVDALTLPGQDQTMGRLGFAFTSVGSEESVLVPSAQAGIRVVRLGAQDRFLIEVVSGGGSPTVKRFEVGTGETVVVPLPESTIQSLSLRFRFLPGLNIYIRSFPGNFLIWLALPLIAIGALGFWQRPRFVLCQLAAWPVERALLIVQSDDAASIATLLGWAKAEPHE